MTGEVPTSVSIYSVASWLIMGRLEGESGYCPPFSSTPQKKKQKQKQNKTNMLTNTVCVNKSASLMEHFFLRKLYVSFVKVYCNNMIGNIINFYRIFVLCNLDLHVWFRNYGKSCKVPPNLVMTA